MLSFIGSNDAQSECLPDSARFYVYYPEREKTKTFRSQRQDGSFRFLGFMVWALSKGDAQRG